MKNTHVTLYSKRPGIRLVGDGAPFESCWPINVCTHTYVSPSIHMRFGHLPNSQRNPLAVSVTCPRHISTPPFACRRRLGSAITWPTHAFLLVVCKVRAADLLIAWKRSPFQLFVFYLIPHFGRQSASQPWCQRVFRSRLRLAPGLHASPFAAINFQHGRPLLAGRHECVELGALDSFWLRGCCRKQLKWTFSFCRNYFLGKSLSFLSLRYFVWLSWLHFRVEWLLISWW